MVELGEDVAVIIDGMTLARAYNQISTTTAEATRAILMRLLYISPRGSFGAGRKLEEGGYPQS